MYLRADRYCMYPIGSQISKLVFCTYLTSKKDKKYKQQVKRIKGRQKREEINTHVYSYTTKPVTTVSFPQTNGQRNQSCHGDCSTVGSLQNTHITTSPAPWITCSIEQTSTGQNTHITTFPAPWITHSIENSKGPQTTSSYGKGWRSGFFKEGHCETHVG